MLSRVESSGHGCPASRNGEQWLFGHHLFQHQYCLLQWHGIQGLFCYGYYEASIQWNGKPGMWSAFWMNSPNTGLYDGNPFRSGAGVDICEHRYTEKEVATL
jgi:hypothetical protein